MSKILIALYMGVVAGYDRDAQGPNYGNQHGAEGRTREPDDDSFSGLDCAQPVGGNFANKKYQNTSKGTTPRLTGAYKKGS